MKRLLFVLLGVMLFLSGMGQSGELPDQRIRKNLIVYGTLDIQGDSAMIPYIVVDSININGSVFKETTGSVLADTSFVNAAVLGAELKLVAGSGLTLVEDTLTFQYFPTYASSVDTAAYMESGVYKEFMPVAGAADKRGYWKLLRDGDITATEGIIEEMYYDNTDADKYTYNVSLMSPTFGESATLLLQPEKAKLGANTGYVEVLNDSVSIRPNNIIGTELGLAVSSEGVLSYLEDVNTTTLSDDDIPTVAWVNSKIAVGNQLKAGNSINIINGDSIELADNVTVNDTLEVALDLLVRDTLIVDLIAEHSGATPMVYPSAGIAVSTGTSWGASIVDNSGNWNTAYGWGDHSIQGYITDASINTLTNKTINADNNTISNIDDGEIRVGAAIDAAKLSAGNVSNIEFDYLDGVTSAIQTQLDAKVNNIGDEQIGGIKTFTSFPITPSSPPTTDYQVANKKYVDDQTDALSPLTTKGDLWVYSNQDTRLPLGNDGQILLAASYLDEGLKWSDQVEQSQLLKSKLNIGDNNTSLWLISPKAHYYNGNIYFCYNDYTANTRKVAKYDYSTGNWTSTTWTQSSLLSTGATPRNRAHAAPTIFMDSNGYIHITYGGYDDDYIRTVRSTNPDDISSFEPEVTIENTPVTAAASYPTIFEKGSTLICFYRGGDADSPVLSRAISTDNGDTWGSIIDITAEYPYHQTRIDNSGRVHITYHQKPSTKNENLYYLYSDDIENVSPTFHDINGTLVSIPATSSDALVFNSSIYDQCYLLGMDADNASRPHIFAYLSDATEENRLSYFSYRNSEWVEDTIELGNFSSWTVGAVQGDVQFKNDSALYLMSEYIKDPTYGTYGKAEIKEWVSYDYGDTWNFNQFITENTETTTANPLYVRESGEVMWFEGSNDYGVGKSVHIGYSPNSRFTSPVVYSSLPVSPNQTPTKDYELATKKYVDDNSGGSGLPSGVQGDILYNNGTIWTTLSAGTAGDFLKTQGSGANPIWDSPTNFWTGTTNGIYYNSGNVSIGNPNPNSTFDLVIGNGNQTTSTSRADLLISNAGLADFGIKNSTNNIEFSFTAATLGVNAVTRSGQYLLFQTLDTGSYVGMDAESGTDEIVAYADEVTINTVLHLTPRASAPTSPVLGTLYVNSGDNHIYMYNGSTWVQLDN